LGLWPALESLAAPLERLTLVDDSGSLFRPPPITFAAAELGLDAFGWNIDLGDLLRALSQALEAEPNIDRRRELVAGFSFADGRARVALASGEIIVGCVA